MDFIERIFHIAPDNGSGLTEWAIVVACVCACLLFAARTAAARSSRRLGRTDARRSLRRPGDRFVNAYRDIAS
jgi:hypothetical protein